jgi:hypothetical protein
MNSPKPLVAEPTDRTPDLGSRHRGGLFALFVAVFCGISAAGAVLLFWREGDRMMAMLVALLLGGPSLWAWSCLVERWRARSTLPRSHAVLTGALGFDIRCTCRDVAATIFLYPDELVPRETARLLCFVENFASRRRIAHLRIGPHVGLGLSEARFVSLELAAGQAAVYALPLTAAVSLKPGEHDLPVTLKVDQPTGTGARLPGTPRHLYDLWTLHFATPFTLTAVPPPVPPGSAASNLSRPCFLTLASANEPEPQLHALEALLSGKDLPRHPAEPS